MCVCVVVYYVCVLWCCGMYVGHNMDHVYVVITCIMCYGLYAAIRILPWPTE